MSLVDRLADGLSSVYTFFEPGVDGGELRDLQHPVADRALPELGLSHLYLGYWIAESRKMAYKATFRPIEGLVEGAWRRLPRSN